MVARVCEIADPCVKGVGCFSRTRNGLDTSVGFNIDVLLARLRFCVVIEATIICRVLLYTIRLITVPLCARPCGDRRSAGTAQKLITGSLAIHISLPVRIQRK